jgi:hypothetical protein
VADWRVGEEASCVREIADAFHWLRDARGSFSSLPALSRFFIAPHMPPAIAPCSDGACSDTKDTEEIVLHFSHCAHPQAALLRPSCNDTVTRRILTNIESTYKIRFHPCRSAGAHLSSALELEDRSRGYGFLA